MNASPTPERITIQCASRLHLGLLHLGAETTWLDCQGTALLPARRFGGVGLMVEQPGLRLHLEPAKAWSAEGVLAERALTFAAQLAQGLHHQAPLSQLERGVGGEGKPDRYFPPQRLVIDGCPGEHLGLGTGTQLGLAVARGLAEAWGLQMSVAELARRAGRGMRSALGVHGFEQGGFLVDAGKRGPEELAPLAVRMAFPAEWRVVLVLPAHERGLHGRQEQEAFRWLSDQASNLAATEALCRLVLLGMLPALAEADLDAFGEAVHDFNRRVGLAFAPVQHGPYASPTVAGIVEYIRSQGIRGAGQSSWGPAVFAVVGEEDRGRHLLESLQRRFGAEAFRLIMGPACNRGARVLRVPVTGEGLAAGDSGP